MTLDAKIAILATDGFEKSELTEPLEKLTEAGATVHVVSPKSGTIKSWDNSNWGEEVEVDCTIEEAEAQFDSYDALVLPGGVINSDKIRVNEDAQHFVAGFFRMGRPVSAICHGPQILIDCEVLQGREMTSHKALKNDLKKAGARWTDQEVVCDQALTTSRTPEDLPAFIDKTIEEVREGIHAGQKTA